MPAVAAVAEKRDFSDPIALNWTQDGTDIDFGSLSKQLIGYGVRNGNVALFGHEVRNLSRESDGQLGAQGAQPPHRRHPQDQHQVRLHWGVRRRTAAAAEGRYPGDQGVFGGFPVGGKFLRTSNPEVAARHRAKVYGLPALGAPPMSALHLDARIINAKSWLLFGPFAGWSPKFLKQGNVTDLPLSVKPNNCCPCWMSGSQVNLVNYLVSQLLLSDADRVDALREFAPRRGGFGLGDNGCRLRVQVIGPAKGKAGVLEFGTTVLSASDGSIAALLGASPGASTGDVRGDGALLPRPV